MVVAEDDWQGIVGARRDEGIKMMVASRDWLPLLTTVRGVCY